MTLFDLLSQRLQDICAQNPRDEQFSAIPITLASALVDLYPSKEFYEEYVTLNDLIVNRQHFEQMLTHKLESIIGNTSLYDIDPFWLAIYLVQQVYVNNITSPDITYEQALAMFPDVIRKIGFEPIQTFLQYCLA